MQHIQTFIYQHFMETTFLLSDCEEVEDQQQSLSVIQPLRRGGLLHESKKILSNCP